MIIAIGYLRARRRRGYMTNVWRRRVFPVPLTATTVPATAAVATKAPTIHFHSGVSASSAGRFSPTEAAAVCPVDVGTVRPLGREGRRVVVDATSSGSGEIRVA